MFSQEEDNRKKLLVTAMSNINSGRAEEDFIKMLVLLRGEKRDLICGSLENKNVEMKLQVVFRDLFVCFTKKPVSVQVVLYALFPFPCI